MTLSEVLAGCGGLVGRGDNDTVGQYITGLCGPGLAHTGGRGASGCEGVAGCGGGLDLLALACLLFDLLRDLVHCEDDILFLLLSQSGVQSTLAGVCPPGDGVVSGCPLDDDGGVRGGCSPPSTRTTSPS